MSGLALSLIHISAANTFDPEEVAKIFLEGAEDHIDMESSMRVLILSLIHIYSIRDTIGELMSHPEAGKILQKFAFEPLMEQAKGADKEGGGGILKRASSVPFEAILPFIRKKLPKYTELIINEQLIKIRK